MVWLMPARSKVAPAATTSGVVAGRLPPKETQLVVVDRWTWAGGEHAVVKLEVGEAGVPMLPSPPP